MIYVVRTLSKPAFIKIGFSEKNVEYRIRKLQTACPYEIETLKIFEGSLRDEKEIHFKLWEHQHRGEWFKDCKEVLKFFDLPKDVVGTKMKWNRQAFHRKDIPFTCIPMSERI